MEGRREDEARLKADPVVDVSCPVLCAAHAPLVLACIISLTTQFLLTEAFPHASADDLGCAAAGAPVTSAGGSKVCTSRSHVARSISTAASGGRARWAQAAAALRHAKFGPGARVASPTQPLYHLSFFDDVVSVRGKLLNYSHHDAAQWARLELVSRRIDAGCSPFIHSNGNVVSATMTLAMMKGGTACAVERQRLMRRRHYQWLQLLL